MVAVITYIASEPAVIACVDRNLQIIACAGSGKTDVVSRRIDLIRRLDTDEGAVVDFKSTERAQPEDLTRDQLHVYALGYEELVGQQPDLIEVLNLDERGKSVRRHAAWCSHCATRHLLVVRVNASVLAKGTVSSFWRVREENS